MFTGSIATLTVLGTRSSDLPGKPIASTVALVAADHGCGNVLNPKRSREGLD
jgi:hypothetical protein